MQGPPDPLKPNVLVYEPQADGKLRLVAAEWLVPLAVAKERPSLFGQPFQGPMEGHEPLIPREFLHYDLHAWLVENPEGTFSPTNPNVNCDHADFSLMEMPTNGDWSLRSKTISAGPDPSGPATFLLRPPATRHAQKTRDPGRRLLIASPRPILAASATASTSSRWVAANRGWYELKTHT